MKILAPIRRSSKDWQNEVELPSDCISTPRSGPPAPVVMNWFSYGGSANNPETSPTKLLMVCLLPLGRHIFHLSSKILASQQRSCALFVSDDLLRFQRKFIAPTNGLIVVVPFTPAPEVNCGGASRPLDDSSCFSELEP
jgi:hypothetical protein